MSTKTRNTNSRSTSRTRSTTTARPLTVELSGKPATSAYFEKSGIRYNNKTNQRPFIAFRRNNEKVSVEIVEDVQTLLEMPNKTRVMAQWEGKNRSDFYRFTVGELKEYLAENPASRHMVV